MQTIKWLNWFKKNSYPFEGLECSTSIKHFKKNNQAFIRACKKGDFETVSMMYEEGFDVYTKILCDKLQFKSDYMFLNESDADLMSEFSLLEAIASPPFLFAMHEHYEEFDPNQTLRHSKETQKQHALLADPILCAMRLIKICSTIANRRKAMINKVDDINKSLKSFTTKMLDLCSGSEEITLFLKHDDNLEDVAVRGSNLLPRINQAIYLEFKEFVMHDSCQNVIRESYYGNTPFRKRTEGTLFMLAHFLLQVVKTPFVCLGHSLAKVVCFAKNRAKKTTSRQNSLEENNRNAQQRPSTLSAFQDLNKNLEVPVNRLLSHSAAYLAFVGFIILALQNPSDTEGKLEIEWYNVIPLVMAIGFVISDCEQMYILSCTVNADALKNKCSISMARCQAFFGNSAYNFEFAGHVAYLAGALIQGIGFFCLDNKYNLKCTFVKEDDLTNYKGLHPVKIGICLQGIAILMVMTKLLQFLRLHSSVSSIYLGMSECAYIIVSFFMTYGTISCMFSVSLYFVLRGSLYTDDPLCDKDVVEMAKTYTKFDDIFKTLVFSTFDPGYPEFFDKCTEGIARYVGRVLWFLYYVVVTIVLFNILIALMNVATMNKLEDTINTWKYNRSLLWMRFCGKSVVLPSPMNILDLILTLPARCCLR